MNNVWSSSSTVAVAWLVRHRWTARLALLVAMRYLWNAAWPRKSLAGKTFVVTGAGGGIGRCIVLELVRHGANVALWDISNEAVSTVAEEARQLSLSTGKKAAVLPYAVDISKREAVYDAAKQVQRDMGFVYGIINNAGVVSGRPFLECDDEDYIRTMNVNAMAHFWTVKAFLPDMVARKEGHIACVASAAGLFGAAKMVDYCSSKFAAVGFAEALRQELHSQGLHGIRTTTVCPAHVKTQLFQGYDTGLSGRTVIRSLSPDAVARALVLAVRKNDPLVFLPGMVTLTYFMKAVLPTFFYDRMLDLAGSNSAMNTFTGNK